MERKASQSIITINVNKEGNGVPGSVYYRTVVMETSESHSFWQELQALVNKYAVEG